jgi:hypothetical protein
MRSSLNLGRGPVRRRLLVSGAAMLGAAVLASSAAAVAPVTTTGSFTQTIDVQGLCPFTVTVVSAISFREMDFYDTNGKQTMALINVNEQDVFGANGKTLTGIPFTFELQFLLDSSGNFTNVFANGVVEKVPLPDGSLFLSAGRLDFAARPSGFALTPDVGRSGNVAGFCAALSA